jgi:hypothetical protein
LKMTLEVVDKILNQPTGERREALESYHQKLTELLHEIKTRSDI